MNLDRWKRYSERPLIAVSVVFLVAYAWEVIADLQGNAGLVADVVINATWVVFVLDYVVNFALVERKWRWFYTHLFDLAVVALPLLRPLRLLRLLTLLGILQRTAGAALRGKVVIYVVGASILLIFTAALAMLDTERDVPGASILSFGDALWWSIVTLTTVGYGDLYPVSAMGRVIATGVMLGGIALIGVVTATLASWIVERVANRDEQELVATRRDIQLLADEIAQCANRCSQGKEPRAEDASPRANATGSIRSRRFS